MYIYIHINEMAIVFPFPGLTAAFHDFKTVEAWFGRSRTHKGSAPPRIIGVLRGPQFYGPLIISLYVLS